MVSWFGMVREIDGDTGNTKTFLHNNSSAATGGKKKKYGRAMRWGGKVEGSHLECSSILSFCRVHMLCQKINKSIN